MAHRVVFTPEARDDLKRLYLYIAEQSGDDRALTYITRIEIFCRGFADFPERGTRRDDLFPGLRGVGFERRVAVAFHVLTDTVIFDRILYGGQNLDVFE
ncbi:type II toxin-antitoxin system RelE/ParE family toxin [Rhizobium sp. 32-5/1]|uniref:type II toxin-antitoxin system RelE/ParE family toxin n=1 Tax=Rhizobium sp. 32-5/1 TaxID=3019602 RepID=UPI00240D565B|nr:type II toxin-antitoxin system RelE/ParE family toxin [Rhizobium sp. 32-5/1]WEZ82876.1 type II toxin-antitoxin system RelE/ParE family toxin [Rhizobium sp. 32-5/1]